ncbi:alkaline phosphatase family protein [Aerococcus kribbianus]|uniref:Ectonucleotide pyrophosphatase/phosphodiesterase n=1 Tax=Aerococcus kribbianus TaxID=2999064 RepID=A0A9X3FVH0_9LACT|nr:MULTISPECIES: ectonucleotide pyrophosphatase/phosphodiesterase [unclassified Aerococcus]MCZ0716984.1 ectonucleotide pyrophosphatase/phosphodiesterase [Aerococcus sp. YH-aer221]MCZ0725272.1 ectonucleotide pyrophosphatase/phosphodiesterase [Aerococcus sp. YH-aer222]
MTNNKLIVISLDAFGSADLDYALSLPNFKRFRQSAALVKSVETVYPSLTYMCHTSIATGNYPNKHGVINNTHLQSHRESPDWYWYSKEIKTASMFDVAKDNGLSTAAILWPVTGRSPSIDYNIAEIFANRKWQSQSLVSLYASSSKYLLEKNQKFKHLRQGIKQPELDHFVTAVTVDTIKKEQPDLLAVHLVDLDSTRHDNGVQSEEAKAAIRRMDSHLGEIFQAIEETPSYRDCHMVLLGDHYQIDTHTVVRPNHLLRDAGYLTVNKKQEIADYQVYLKAADGSAYIYSKDPDFTIDQLQAILAPIQSTIERIYDHNQAQAMGADDQCFAILEAKAGYYFDSSIQRPILEDTNKTIPGVKLLRGSHGYSPQKADYTTMMMVAGPKIDQEVELIEARLVDEGPTFLALLNLAFPQPTDGRVLTELFKSKG